MLKHFLTLACLVSFTAFSVIPACAVNYDESKVPEYTLPDPLIFNDCSAVRTASDWTGKRRAEIFRHFQEEIILKKPFAGIFGKKV